ncbi:MAG: outer membrane protein transport protein, partial [Aquificaceae bacterium]|nr:outer membrane protein transport protein [Aquificaceae bacterium]MDW8236877.1 outer membrane protein transport protein [Aquificaceae bacterium]
MRLVLALAILSGAALATNGDNLIGVTPASRAMGGIGVGLPLSATDAPFRNPAWMRSHKGYSFSFGGIVFAPSVKTRIQNPLGDSGNQKSKADLFVIPEVGLVMPVGERLSLGLGAFGVSGLGVDYTNNERLLSAFDPRTNLGAMLNMRTNFQFMRVIPSFSYELSEGLYLGGGLH